MSDFENLDYYDLLGVSRSASFDEIKRAYRREISKYHPDRFVNATPEKHVYGGLRSQRLTEAYAVLSNAAARNAYDRTQYGARPTRGAPPQQRDHQAELYDQAISHLSSGRPLQAIGALRQLQQINPFYRDSGELLASAEAQLNQRAERSGRWRLSPLLLISGALVGLVVVAAAAWVLNARFITSSRTAAGATAAVAATDTAQQAAPTAAPEPIASAPTELPTTVPTAAPTEVPTAVPTAAPTEVPTAVPTDAPAGVTENGALLLADTFSSPGWADLRGPTWRVGYQGRRYQISSNAGNGPIWSYRAAPEKDVSIGVDLQISSGEGGMLVRFLDASNYLSMVINPSQTSYRIEQLSGGVANVLAGGQSAAIQLGADAMNRLVVRLRGDHIQMLVNGQLLAEVDANRAPDTLRYGLLVIAKDTPAEGIFDNLEIRALE